MKSKAYRNEKLLSKLIEDLQDIHDAFVSDTGKIPLIENISHDWGSWPEMTLILEPLVKGKDSEAKGYQIYFTDFEAIAEDE